MFEWLSDYFSRRYARDCHYHPWHVQVARIPFLRFKTKHKIANNLSRWWGNYWCRKYHRPLWVTGSVMLGGTTWGYKCRFCGCYWEEKVSTEEDLKRREQSERTAHKLRQLTETPDDKWIDSVELERALGLRKQNEITK